MAVEEDLEEVEVLEVGGEAAEEVVAIAIETGSEGRQGTRPRPTRLRCRSMARRSLLYETSSLDRPRPWFPPLTPLLRPLLHVLP